MKLTLSLLAASFAAIAALPVNAATATAGFNVTANLTSKCEVTTAVADVAFTYTSFQTTAATAAGGGFSVRCTTSLPYSFSVSGSPGAVIGLNYSLTAPAGSTGTGAAQAFTIGGSMGANQSGTCATTAACTGTVGHTLTVTY